MELECEKALRLSAPEENGVVADRVLPERAAGNGDTVGGVYRQWTSVDQLKSHLSQTLSLSTLLQQQMRERHAFINGKKSKVEWEGKKQSREGGVALSLGWTRVIL